MLQCLLYCSVVGEFKIFILNSFENWDPYVRAKYKTISERHQGAEKLFFQISNLTSTTCKFKVVFHHNNNTQAHSARSKMGHILSEWIRQILIYDYKKTSYMTIENVINCEKCNHTITIGSVLSLTQQLTIVQLMLWTHKSGKERNISQIPDIAQKLFCACN